MTDGERLQMRKEQPQGLLLFVQRNIEAIRIFKKTCLVRMSGDFKSALKETLLVARPLGPRRSVVKQA